MYESGNFTPFQQGVIKGWVVGGETETPERFFVGGWVVDQQESALVSSVVALVNGEVVATGFTQFERPEAVKMFENPALLLSGFRLEFHLPVDSASGAARVRVLAVSGGVAGELNYPRDTHFWPFSPQFRPDLHLGRDSNLQGGRWCLSISAEGVGANRWGPPLLDIESLKLALETKGLHGARSKYSADPQVSIVQQVVTVTANRSQPWLSPNVFPLCA